MLSDLPFTAFEEVGDGVLTAMDEGDWSEEHLEFLNELMDQLPFGYSIEREEARNWNAIWESEFREIQIDDFCLIRAPFHDASARFRYEIVIEPRMAFGTGHHETTRLMIRGMKSLDISGKKVLDFGAGSGILAILAAKMDALAVHALECDEVAFVNLEENIVNNGQALISIQCSDHLMDFSSGYFDVVLANITRNVLVENADEIVRILAKEGKLIVSGFLARDHAIIVHTFEEAGLKSEGYLEENDWIANIFRK